MKRAFLALLVCFALIIPATGSADNLPRDYIPAPPGCLAILMYYQHLSADSLFADGHKVLSDVDFSGNIGIFRPVYWLEWGPMIIDPQVFWPFYGDFDLRIPSGDPQINDTHLSSTQVGDPVLLATFWFIHNAKSKTWLGFTPFFWIPVGDIDNDGAFSPLAEDRWKFREELGFVQGFEVIPGHNAYFELQIGGDFFTDNNDFGPTSAKLEQDPVFNLESHLSYDLTSSIFVSADYYGHFLGETTINGVDQDNELNNHAVGFTLAYNIAPSYQLLLQYKADVQVEEGLETQGITFRFLYACDVGYLFGKPAAAAK